MCAHIAINNVELCSLVSSNVAIRVKIAEEHRISLRVGLGDKTIKKITTILFSSINV